nr:MAG TPA: hypothetical protein [Siphoviridae sp. ctX8T1]
MLSLFDYIQEFEFVTASPSWITDVVCRLATSIRFRDNIIRSSAEPKQTLICLLQPQPSIHPRRPFSHQLVPCFIFESIFTIRKDQPL